MFIREAMQVFWQTLKDTWEELYSLAIVNLVWLLSLAPLALVPVSAGLGSPVLPALALLVGLGTTSITSVGMYYVTNRVAHGKTFSFAHFTEGMRLYWWRALLWLLILLVASALLAVNMVFYARLLTGWAAMVVGGIWLAALVFWLAMQIYYWPLLIEQEHTKMLLAWRNSAYLILANPFYAFFVVSFTILLFGLSVLLTLPLIFVGMALVGLLANNGVLILLEKFGIIKEARPKPL